MARALEPQAVLLRLVLAKPRLRLPHLPLSVLPRLRLPLTAVSASSPMQGMRVVRQQLVQPQAVCLRA